MTEFLTENTSLPPYMVFPRFLLDMELNEARQDNPPSRQSIYESEEYETL